MAKKIGIIICALVTAMTVLLSCAEKELTRSTEKAPTIPSNETTFDVTVDEFIEIINGDLHENDMDPIPTAYQTERYISGEAEEYECVECYVEISEGLSVTFYTFPELGDEIAVVLLKCKGAPNIDSDLHDLADQYYRIICQNVQPQFDAENFQTYSSHNEHYTLENLIFYCIYSQVQEGNQDQYNLRTYGIHGVGLDDKYENF